MWCNFGSLWNLVSFCSRESNVSRIQLLFPQEAWQLGSDEPSNMRQPQLESFHLLSSIPATKLLLLWLGTHWPSIENVDLSCKIMGIFPCTSWRISWYKVAVHNVRCLSTLGHNQQPPMTACMKVSLQNIIKTILILGFFQSLLIQNQDSHHPQR